MPIIDTVPIVLGLVFYLAGLKQEQIAELDLRKAKGDLAKSQSLLETAERVEKYGSWELDVATKKSTWSKGLYTLLQMSPTVDPSESNSTLSQMLVLEQKLQQALSDPLEGREREFTIQYHVKLKDGAVRTLRGQVSILLDDKSNPTQMFGTVQDITELDLAKKKPSFTSKP